jgi:hypothetical protein
MMVVPLAFFLCGKKPSDFNIAFLCTTDILSPLLLQLLDGRTIPKPFLMFYLDRTNELLLVFRDLSASFEVLSRFRIGWGNILLTYI